MVSVSMFVMAEYTIELLEVVDTGVINLEAIVEKYLDYMPYLVLL